MPKPTDILDITVRISREQFDYLATYPDDYFATETMYLDLELEMRAISQAVLTTIKNMKRTEQNAHNEPS